MQSPKLFTVSIIGKRRKYEYTSFSGDGYYERYVEKSDNFKYVWKHQLGVFDSSIFSQIPLLAQKVSSSRYLVITEIIINTNHAQTWNYIYNPELKQYFKYYGNINEFLSRGGANDPSTKKIFERLTGISDKETEYVILP